MNVLKLIISGTLFLRWLNLDLGHWLVLRRIESWQARLRGSQRSEVRLRHLQTPVIGERRAITPGQSIGRSRRLDRRLTIARVALDLRQDVARIGVKEPEWPALDWFPGIVQQPARGL